MRKPLDGSQSVLQCPSDEYGGSFRPRASPSFGINTQSRGAKRQLTTDSPQKGTIPPLVLDIVREAVTGWEPQKLHPIWVAPEDGFQVFLRPPSLTEKHYECILSTSFGEDAIKRVQHADTLATDFEAEARYIDAANAYEQGLLLLDRSIRKQIDYGASREEIKRIWVDYEIRCVQVVALCLFGARRLEQQEELDVAFLLLKKAETLTTSTTGLQYCKRVHQRVATHQAFACYYRRQKKYQAALQCIQNASKCNQKLLAHERLAIVEFLHGYLLYQVQQYPQSLGRYSMCYEIAQEHFQQVPIDKRPAAHHILMVAALHNITIARVQLLQPEEARKSLTLAMETAMRYILQNHKVVKRLLDTYENLRGYLNPKEIPQTNRNSSPSRPLSVKSLTKPSGSESPRVAKLRQQGKGSLEGGAVRPLTTPLISASNPSRSHSSMIHYTGIQDGIFEHALGGKYRPYRSEIIAEAKCFVRRRRAAHRIQRLWKLCKKKRSQEAHLSQMQEAARTYYDHAQIKREAEGAKHIQSAWRRRKKQKKLQRTRMIAVRKIQRAWRKKVRDHRKKLHNGKAVIIQRNVRIFLKQLALQRSSATSIQSQVRGMIARRNYMMHQKAASTINRFLRGATVHVEFHTLQEVVEWQVEVWIFQAKQRVLQKKLIHEQIVRAWIENGLNAVVLQRMVSLETSAILVQDDAKILSPSETDHSQEVAELPVMVSIMINLAVSAWTTAAIQNVMKRRGYEPLENITWIPRDNHTSILPVQVSIWIQQHVSYCLIVGIQTVLDTLLVEIQEVQGVKLEEDQKVDDKKDQEDRGNDSEEDSDQQECDVEYPSELSFSEADLVAGERIEHGFLRWERVVSESSDTDETAVLPSPLEEETPVIISGYEVDGTGLLPRAVRRGSARLPSLSEEDIRTIIGECHEDLEEIRQEIRMQMTSRTHS